MCSLVHKLQPAHPVWGGQMVADSKLKRKQPKTCPERNPRCEIKDSVSLWSATWRITAHGDSGLWVSLREFSRNWTMVRHLGLLPLLLRNLSECLLLFGPLFSPWQKKTLGEISFISPSSGVSRQVSTGTLARDLTFSTMDRMWHAPRGVHLTWLCNHNWSSLRTPMCSPNPGAPCEPVETLPPKDSVLLASEA